jgi:hypothetical protein
MWNEVNYEICNTCSNQKKDIHTSTLYFALIIIGNLFRTEDVDSKHEGHCGTPHSTQPSFHLHPDLSNVGNHTPLIRQWEAT